MLLIQVKPAMPYLDVIKLLHDSSPLPISAYQVITMKQKEAKFVQHFSYFARCVW